jgi:uncharacterized protein with HEPN domain
MRGPNIWRSDSANAGIGARDAAALADIIEAINRIQRYVGSAILAEILARTETQDAIVRNFQVIGEAVKLLSDDLRRGQASARPWPCCLP